MQDAVTQRGRSFHILSRFQLVNLSANNHGKVLFEKLPQLLLTNVVSEFYC